MEESLKESLIRLGSEFESYRRDYLGGRYKYPSDLVESVIYLSKRVPRTELRRYLKISSSTLHRWLCDIPDSRENVVPEFTELVKVESFSSISTIEVNLGSEEFPVIVNFTASECANFAIHFRKELKRCSN
jgi:hypothetical protein